MIAVDTNVLVHFWLPSPKTSLAEKIFLKDSDWVVPVVWRSEFRNVIAQYVKRGVSLEEATAVIAKAEAQMRDRELFVESNAVVELAVNSGCTAHDCEFVYVAQMQAIPLITFERQVLLKFPTIAIEPEKFVHS